MNLLNFISNKDPFFILLFSVSSQWKFGNYPEVGVKMAEIIIAIKIK